MNWIVYNELAWTDNILACPEAYEEKAMNYAKLIKDFISVPFPTMLHLGCGAGGHDFHFKKHFQVTGVDVSPGMLDMAKKTNADVAYIMGDMRTICLNEKFDAVVIPDSIAYMSTLEDLKQTLINATSHLKTGRVLLFVMPAGIIEKICISLYRYRNRIDIIPVTVYCINEVIIHEIYEF